MPLGSHAAKKSIGKLLTFYDRGGLQKVRLYNKPTGLPSDGQTAQRLVIAGRVAAWQALSDEDKAAWNSSAKALGDPWSGYTLFMSTYVEEGPMPHNLFSADHPDTVVGSPVSGDIIYGNATPKWAKLAKGDNDKVLTLKSGLPSWETPAGGVSEKDLAFLDNFDDGSRHWGWADDEKNGGITESGDIIMLSVADGISGGLSGSSFPRCLLGDPGAPFEVKVKLNSYIVRNCTQAGICISVNSSQGGNDDWLLFGRTKRAEDAGLDGLAVTDFAGGWSQKNAVTTLPIYLRFRITVLSKDAAAICECAYSTDDIDYTVLDTVALSSFSIDSPKDNLVVGIFARNRVGSEAGVWTPLIEAPFEWFKMGRTLGPG